VVLLVQMLVLALQVLDLILQLGDGRGPLGVLAIELFLQTLNLSRKSTQKEMKCHVVDENGRFNGESEKVRERVRMMGKVLGSAKKSFPPPTHELWLQYVCTLQR